MRAVGQRFLARGPIIPPAFGSYFGRLEDRDVGSETISWPQAPPLGSLVLHFRSCNVHYSTDTAVQYSTIIAPFPATPNEALLCLFQNIVSLLCWPLVQLLFLLHYSCLCVQDVLTSDCYNALEHSPSKQ